MHKHYANTEALKYLECYIKCEEFLETNIFLEIDKGFYESLEKICPYQYEIKLKNNYKKYKENNITKEEIRSFINDLMNGCASKFNKSEEKIIFCNF